MLPLHLLNLCNCQKKAAPSHPLIQEECQTHDENYPSFGVRSNASQLLLLEAEISSRVYPRRDKPSSSADLGTTINHCCFKPLSFWVIWNPAIDYRQIIDIIIDSNIVQNYLHLASCFIVHLPHPLQCQMKVRSLSRCFCFSSALLQVITKKRAPFHKNK